MTSKTKSLREVAQAVVRWNTDYPSSTIYSEGAIRAIAAEMDVIFEDAKAALATRETSAVERLHNLCDGLSDHADESPFTREEWERIDKETAEKNREIKRLRALLRQAENLAVIGDIEEDTEAHGWGEWLKETRSALKGLPVETSVRQSVTLNGYQLKEALEFIAPDSDAEQLESDVTIEWGDEGHAGKGYYASMTEYPDEGSVLLDGKPPEQPEKTSEPYCEWCMGAHVPGTIGGCVAPGTGASLRPIANAYDTMSGSAEKPHDPSCQCNACQRIALKAK